MQITCYSTVLRDNNSTSFCNLFMRQLQQLVSLPEEMNTSVFVPQKVLKSLTTVGVSWFTSLVICFSHRLPAFHSNLLRKSPSPSLEKGCLIFTGVTPFIFLIETIIPTNTAALEMQCCHLPSWASTNISFVMLSFNPANAQWPLQMLFSSMHCLLHVPISLVTKFWNCSIEMEKFLPAEGAKLGKLALAWQIQVLLPVNCNLNSVLWGITSNIFEKIHTAEQQGTCTVSEGDSKYHVLTHSRTNTVSTSQIQICSIPALRGADSCPNSDANSALSSSWRLQPGL